MAEREALGNTRFLIQATLGQGGMGAVYSAVDRQNGQVCALKRLRLSGDEARNRRFVELFHQEYRTLAQLAHPHVVVVHDYGRDDDGPFYTMELLTGDDIHRLAPLPWREACALLADACSAVALLHSRRFLHRDLSPKNIQRTSDGRAKLIDFGAMAAMGPSKTVVGTPPLVPPEALLQQPLDARADLYALGGTLYFALTGRHAYPARHMAQLRAMWRTPPPPPSSLVSDVPRELDALVLTLLSLDPVARPRSAAELLDRLSAIASLPRSEQPAVSRAYLSTPELAGRTEELARMRARIAQLHLGRGGVLAIEGVPGMGRSRMLDTCVLEAKLAGMAVARASAADSSGTAYGVMGALLRQLRDMPGSSGGSTLPQRLLAISEETVTEADADTASRAELQSAFQVLLKARARAQPLLIAVDDIERCDEPSQAALAAAATVCRKERLLFALSTSNDYGAGDGTAVSVLREHAVSIRLAPFEPQETEALLASVFGDVPHLTGLAARVHARAEGSPRSCVELAQYLVDRGFVHYEMGQWVLPARLPEDALPGSLSIARAQKLEALGPDARELAEVLAIADGSGLELDDYVELCEHADPARVRSALDELLFAQLVRSEGGRYGFEAQVWVQELSASQGDQRRAMLCTRMAAALEKRGRDRLEVADFYFRAGDKARTLDLLLAELMLGSRWAHAPRGYPELLRRAVQDCVELGRSSRDRFVLLQELVKVGQDLALPDLHSHLIELFALLRRDSGHSDFEATDASLEALPRLQRALELAQARFDATPALERGLSPIEAVIRLTQLEAETSAVAAQTADYTLFDLLPTLEPFFPLSPAIERVQKLTVPSCRAVVGARYEYARTLYHESLAQLLAAADGIDETTRLWSTRAIHYALGCIEGGLGREQALQHAEVLEKAPGWRVPALCVQQIYHLTLGNLQKAEHYRRQIELLLLQSPVKPPLSAGAVHQHLFVFALADNLNGMRQAIPELEMLAAAHPGLRPFVPFARAEHARICGNYQEALSWLEETADQVKPGEHPLWPWVMSTRLFSLIGLGHYREAREVALRELESATRVGLEVMSDHIEIPLAIADAKLGDLAGACERLDRLIPARLNSGMQGVVIGWAFEARARVALWMGDAQAFEQNAQLCAQQFKKSGGEPALAAKYERLMQEARYGGLELRPELEEAMVSDTTVERTAHTQPALRDDMTTAVEPALATCETKAQRAQCALELLVDRSDALQGQLFLLGPEGLALACSTTDMPLTDEIVPALMRLMQIDGLDDDEERTAYGPGLTLAGVSQADGTPSNVWPLLLSCARKNGTVVAGVVTLHFSTDARVRLPAEVATALASALIESGDVEPRMLRSSAGHDA